MENNRLNLLLQYHREDPSDAFTLFALAQEYRKQGETDSAVQYFEQLRTEHPEYVGLYYHLGKVYESLDRKNEAVAVYHAGVRIANTQRDYHALSELQDALLKAEGIDDL